MKLIILPFAGGSAYYYNNWYNYIGSNIELIPIELAGRGKRIKEPLYSDLNEMVEDVFNSMKKVVNSCDYMLFGHSLGALTAFELAHYMRLSEYPMPKHIYFSGRYSPNTQKDIEKMIHKLNMEDFKDEIVKMGGVSLEVIEHPEISEMFLPVLKNDIRLAETYNYINNRPPLQCDFSVLYGTKENYSMKQILGWRKLTSKKCDFYQFEGGHFFINEHTDKIVELIYNCLLE